MRKKGLAENGWGPDIFGIFCLAFLIYMLCLVGGALTGF